VVHKQAAEHPFPYRRGNKHDSNGDNAE